MYVEPEPLVDLDQLADRIKDGLPDVQARSMSQFNLQVGNIMGKLDLFLLLTVGLALVVGGVGIANTMLMSAMERIVDFGVMRAGGWMQEEASWAWSPRGRVRLLGVASRAYWPGVLAFSGIELLQLPAHPLSSELGWTSPRWWPPAFCHGHRDRHAGRSLYPAWRAPALVTPMDAIRNEAS